jgi:hypothetical protein
MTSSRLIWDSGSELLILKRLVFFLLAVGLWCGSERLWAQSFVFSTLAGNAGYGSVDGPTNQARFDFPQGVAADSTGNIYVADTQNSTIRKIDPNGNVTTFAGKAGVRGQANGPGTQARFANPQSLAVDGGGNVYVADTANHTIRKITPDGVVSTLAGSPGVSGSSNGVNSGVLFNLPGGVAVDSAGVLYVADTRNSTIRKVTPVGTNWVGTTIAGVANANTNLDGTNISARFYWPSGIAVDTNLNLYVSDTGNNSIRKITPSGTNWITTTLLTVPAPGGIAIDAASNILVAATSDNTIRKITWSGTNWVQSTLAGTSGLAGSTDGAAHCSFNDPFGIAVLADGHILVADSLNNTIRRLTPGGTVSTLAGLSGGPGSADGEGSQARFDAPLGLAVDAAGTVYLADSENSTIRSITSAGLVTTLAGAATNLAGSVDGSGAQASFNGPAAMVVDNSRNLYVADRLNNQVRKIIQTGTNWMVTTLAGRAGSVFYGSITNIVGGTTNVSVVLASKAAYTNYSGLITNVTAGVTNVVVVITNVPTLTNGAQIVHLATNTFTLPAAPPKLDGVGTNALFFHPSGLALDSQQNLVVADGGTNGLRLVTADGAVSTMTGSIGAYVVGTNTLPFQSTAVAIDETGNLFVSDKGNNTIRQITASGATTIVGSPGLFGTADGSNAVARFASPVAIALDGHHNLYVTDALSHTIRKIAHVGPDWVVTTVAGAAGVSGNLDDLGAQARFNNPSGIAFDNFGNVYVADTGNNSIRLGQPIASAPVTLHILRLGSEIVVSWPDSGGSNYVLEVNNNLDGSGSWLPVTNVPSISGPDLTVTNVITGDTAFYRLRWAQ